MMVAIWQPPQQLPSSPARDNFCVGASYAIGLPHLRLAMAILDRLRCSSLLGTLIIDSAGILGTNSQVLRLKLRSLS